jgi:hypothetical protein
MPPAPVCGGSVTTASVLVAVKQAAENVLKKLVRAALADERSPLHGQQEDAVTAANGYVFMKGPAFQARSHKSPAVRVASAQCSMWSPIRLRRGAQSP